MWGGLIGRGCREQNKSHVLQQSSIINHLALTRSWEYMQSQQRLLMTMYESIEFYTLQGGRGEVMVIEIMMMKESGGV